MSKCFAAQWAGYVLHPLIKSNRPYFPNLFDYKLSKYYFKYNKPENPFQSYDLATN